VSLEQHEVMRTFPVAPTIPYALKEVAPGVLVALAAGGGRAGANATIIDLGSQTVVVDAGMTREIGRWLWQTAVEYTGRAPGRLIYTHGHSDHIWGAAGFPPETEIIATGGTHQLLLALAGHEGDWYRSTAPAELERIGKMLAAQPTEARRAQLEAGRYFYESALAELPTLQVRKPTLTFSHRICLHGSSRQMEILTHGGGHTRSDAIVWIPDASILIPGDLVTVNAHPWIGGGDALEWLRILATLETLGATTVIPGHGPVSDGKTIDTVGAYIRCILDMVEGVPLHDDTNDDEPARNLSDAEITEWANSVAMPEAWTDWAFSAFFANNLKQLARRLLDQTTP